MQNGTLIGGTHVYVQSIFDPTVYRLTELETNVLLAQIPALRAIEKLYLLQKGGESNLQLCNTLETAARISRNPRIEEFWFMYQVNGCIHDSSGNKLKPFFTIEEWKESVKYLTDDQTQYAHFGKLITSPELEKQAARGRNVFVNETVMTNGQFVKWASEKFDSDYNALTEAQKSARVHPFLRIYTRVTVKGKDGHYSIEEKPWTEIYPDLIKTASESFWKAGELCVAEYPNYSVILQAISRGMQHNNFDLRDIWLTKNDSRLHTFAGIGEEYIASNLGWSFVKKGAYDFVLAVENSELSKKISETKSKVPILVNRLPADLRNVVKEPTIQAIDTVMIAGDSQHWGSTLAGRNWPNDPLLKSLFPLVTIHAKECNLRVKYLLKPAAQILLPPDEIPDDESLTGYINFETIGHEYGHSIGKQGVYDAALEESKATACAIWNYPLFNESQRAVKQFCWVEPTNLLRRIRSSLDIKTRIVSDAHSIGENSLLEAMYANGAVKITNGMFEVYPEIMTKTAGEYFVHAVQLEAAGNQGEITKYLTPFMKVSQQTLGLVQKLNEARIPRSPYVDRGTIDELEARLFEHLKMLSRKV